jgi:formylglycine-generating enzyme required for sulfatase activity
MVYVPAGEFIMGSDEGPGGGNSRPMHTVYLDTFYIDKTEVTNAQYRKCVETGACSQPHNAGWYNDPNRAEHPVVWVDWYQADAYCRWAGKRLPTSAEWEKAARGTDGLRYPWGDTFDRNGLNFTDDIRNWRPELGDAITEGDGYVDTAPVGSFPTGASPYGALDMAGNVYEWVADWYDEDYYSQLPERNPPGPDSGTYREIRGSSWDCHLERHAYCAGRGWYSPGDGNNEMGFRCAWSSQLTDTPTPMPTALLPTDTPAPLASVALGPCCEPLQPGKGMLWFENFAAFEGAAALGPERYPIGGRQYEAGEAGPTGCLCLQVDPGSHEITVADRWSSPRWETKLWIDVVAGQIWHLPIVGIAGRSETEGAKVEPYLLSQ